MHRARRLLSALLLLGLAVATCLPGALAQDRNLLVAATKAQPSAEPRVALVIGNIDYPTAPLANSINDARAVAQRLTELRFQVTRLENATQEEMYDAIRVFGDRLRDGGVGLFYYAGHALQVRGRNYLLPARALIKREDEILYRTVDTGQIRDKMESARNRVNVVILDACRNNPFGRDFRGIAPGLAVVDAPYNTLIAFATAPGAVASDGNGRNGLYTQHLLQALDSPGLGLEDVFKRVRTGVRQDSAGRQVPWESTSLEVDFYFDPLPNQTALGVPGAPDALTLELAFWDSVKGSSDAEDYRAYLKRYPEGQFAVLARNRLRLMTASAAPTAAPAVALALARPVAAPVPTPVPVLAAPAPAPSMSLSPAAIQSSPSAAPSRPASAAVGMAVPALQLSLAPGMAASPLASNALLGHGAEVLAVAISRNGTQALTGSADRSMRQWDLASGRELRGFLGHSAAVTAIAFASDPRYLLSGGADRSVRLWDSARGLELARMEGHRSAVSALAVGPTSRYAASAAEDGEIILWELPAGTVIRRARAETGRVQSLAFSPEGRFLLTASSDGAVQLWDVSRLEVLRSFGPVAASAPARAAFSEDGRRVSAVDARGDIWSWDTSAGVLQSHYPTGSAPPATAAIATDGASVLTTTADGQLALWDIVSGRALWTSRGPLARMTVAALGPRGAVALAAGDDSRLLRWSSGR